MERVAQVTTFALIGFLSLPLTVCAKSLEEAVATAFNTNPDVRQVYHQYKSTMQDHRIAKSGWYPSVDLTASAGVGDVENSDTRVGIQDEEIEPVSYGISLSQVIFDGFFTPENVERAEYEVQSDLFSLQAQAENTALDVVKVYVEVLKQQQILALSEKNVESHELMQQQIKMRTDNGLGSTSDLSQATGRLARAKANVITARNNYQDAKNAYFRVVGELPNELVYPVADTELLPLSEGILIDKAKVQHPTIKSAIADVRAADAQLSTSQSAYYPKVTLEIGSSHSEDSNNDRLETDELRADLVISYNLFRGGSDSAREMQSAYQVELAKDIKLSAERQVVEGAQFSWNAYDFTNRQLEFLKMHVEQSYLTQNAYQQQFELGRRTLLDLLDTENELFEARKNYVHAEAQFTIAKYRIFNATGELLSSLRIDSKAYWRGSMNE